jgi:hypothetical protein|tara:strand:- start:74 stop:406 length:333 start_codon:yes stop_codon:yes gene_type:complete
MAYNRQTAIDAIARLKERQSQKKDVEFKSFSEKRREERERKIKENKIHQYQYDIEVGVKLNPSKSDKITYVDYKVVATSEWEARQKAFDLCGEEFNHNPYETKSWGYEKI